MDNEKKPAIRFKGFTNAWEQRRLGECVNVGSGMDYKHLSEGNIPVYGTGGYMLSVDKALSSTDNAIGIGRKGTIDKPYILHAPFWTVDTLFYVIPHSIYNLDFMFAVFQNVDWKSKDESTGVPSLSKVAINETQVYITQRDEQDKIAAIFTSLDRLITLHQRKCEKLQNIKKSCLEKMFPKNGKVVPEIRFKGFTNAWEQRRLGEVTSYQISSMTSDSVLEQGIYPVYDANSLIGYTNSYCINEDFITIIKDGSGVGRTRKIKKNSYFIGTMGGILPKYSDISFIYALLQKFNFSLYINGATIPHVYYSDYCQEEITVPNITEQQIIGSFFDTLDRLITLHQRELEKLKNIKKSCLEKMFPT